MPASATVVPGPQAFGPDIESLPNDVKSLARRAKTKRDEVQARALTKSQAEVVSFVTGPTPGSWLLSYWEDKVAKKVELQNITGFLAAGPHGFIYPDQTGDEETPNDVLKNVTYVATHLRARDPKEVPTDPGVCLDVGFIADDSGKFQEIFGIGLRFPELPDASFSVSSNKDAQQGDSFEDRRAEAKRAAFMVAPLAKAVRRCFVAPWKKGTATGMSFSSSTPASSLTTATRLGMPPCSRASTTTRQAPNPAA